MTANFSLLTSLVINIMKGVDYEGSGEMRAGGRGMREINKTPNS
ncbi:hypothetical protein GXM_03814 [Nostoc sphaeroides CCNUC1]|uniref:Uncharacterized protein n=1 Tax=Nostoc sphaeroides CCNUC1 TaxID=2653204 RepID=A0A5P8W0W4_9NOSO|nr:hypothetical protein GXM_03814 [Nostoc sphaeroides CCNUC1]